MKIISAPTRFIYKNIAKPILFEIEPDKVHPKFTRFGKALGSNGLGRWVTKLAFDFKHDGLTQTIAGMEFTNPVGLSAGFDKDADLLNILPSVGFGYMQVGSITNNPYAGNPKPHLYRLPNSKSIAVYYGLKNIGVDKIIDKIEQSGPGQIPFGISIAKTNCSATAEIDAGIKDYLACLEKVEKHNIGNFYTLNISCPNTFGGEPFTTPEKMDLLLKAIRQVNISKPVFLKMPINLPWDKFKQLIEVALNNKVAGLIIGNLNKNRQDHAIKDPIPAYVKGNLSGKPTWQLSNKLISKTYQNFGDRIIIVGVGGIFSAQDAYEKIKRGASLVQLITGMIFEGPQLIGDVNRGLVKLMQQDGFTNISQAVGTHHNHS